MNFSSSGRTPIEHYLGREPFIWAEETRTAKRLHIGSRLTWKGVLVTVTSFNDADKTLTACSYKREKDRERGDLDVGDFGYFGSNRRSIEASKKYDDGTMERGRPLR